MKCLRGPQGTLYGRNTLAGAINVITKQPTNQTKGFASFGYGNLNQIEVNAGISTPIIEDKFFVRLSADSKFRNGYVENTFLKTDNLLEFRQYGGNLRLTYLPSDSLSVSLNSSLSQREIDDYALVGSLFNGLGEGLVDLRNEPPYQVSYNVQGVIDTLISNNALKIDYETDSLSIKSITSVQYTDNGIDTGDFDFSPADISAREDLSRVLMTLSEELRVSSEWNNLRWLVGGFVYNVSQDLNFNYVNGIDNAAFQTDPDTAAQYPYTQNDESVQRYTGFSIFGNADYLITDRLRFIGGIRYEIEQNDAEVKRVFTKDGNSNYIYPNLLAIPGEFEETTTFNAISPKVGISYELSDDIMFFGNMSRGYRPGGINPFTADPEAAIFDPEYSLNYEIGVKSMMLQNRARVNLTGFYISYDDQQLYTVVDPSTFSLGRENLGHSISYGAELETAWALFEGLSAVINVGYLETEITDFKITTPGSQGIVELDNTGNKQGYSPQFNGNIGLFYNKSVTSLLDLKTSIDYQFQTDMYFDPENKLKQEAYGLLNAQVVISTSSADLSIWGQNLTDEVYFSYGYGFGGSSYFANYGLPRTFGSKLTVKF